MDASDAYPWLTAHYYTRQRHSIAIVKNTAQATPPLSKKRLRYEPSITKKSMAVQAFCDFFRLAEAEVLQPASPFEHPQERFIKCTPDALLGSNAILKVEVPEEGQKHGNGNAVITMSPETLVTVFVQLECTQREFALVVYYCDEYMHVFKVLAANTKIHRGLTPTLWEMCLEEFVKCKAMCSDEAQRNDRSNAITKDSQRRINGAIAAYREKAVFKMQLHAGKVGWALETSETAVNPRTFTLIDRVAVPRAGDVTNDADDVEAQRVLRVHWTSKAVNGAFFDPIVDGVDNRPNDGSGGFVQEEYHTMHVKRHLFPRGRAALGIV